MELSPEALAALVVWGKLPAATGHALFRVSRTPMGVVSLEWSPDGRNLWLNVAAEPAGMGGLRTAPLIVDVDSGSGWSMGGLLEYIWGGRPCSPGHDWSPDGQEIAYGRDGQVWLVDVDERSPRALPSPSPETEVGSPRYSPDGSMVAAVGHRAGVYDRHDVWVLDVAAGAWEWVVEDGGSRGLLSWSPSGSAFAYVAPVSRAGVFRVSIAGVAAGRVVAADLPLLATEGCQQDAPSWLMGEQSVLVTLHMTRGLWTVDRDGNVERFEALRGSTPAARPAGLSVPLLGWGGYGAAVSPDGRYVVYSTGAGTYVRDLQTGGEIDLGAEGGGVQCYDGSVVSWAPTGPQFLRWRAPHGERAGAPLDLISAIDGTVRRLACGVTDAAWSPDGRRIAFWQSDPAGDGLWMLDVQDLTLERLTPSALYPSDWDYPAHGYDSTLRWSPDGEYIAFLGPGGLNPEAYLLRLAH